MRASGGAADRLLPHSAHRSIRAGPWPPPADGAPPARYLQGTLLDFGGRFALEPPRGNQHRQAARARLATEKPAVLRRHMPVWTVREAAACGLTEAERAAIVGRSRRFGLSGRAGISSKCEIAVHGIGMYRTAELTTHQNLATRLASDPSMHSRFRPGQACRRAVPRGWEGPRGGPIRAPMASGTCRPQTSR